MYRPEFRHPLLAVTSLKVLDKLLYLNSWNEVLNMGSDLPCGTGFSGKSGSQGTFGSEIEGLHLGGCSKRFYLHRKGRLVTKLSDNSGISISLDEKKHLSWPWAGTLGVSPSSTGFHRLWGANSAPRGGSVGRDKVCP